MKRQQRILTFLILSLVILISASAAAYNHPELKWRTFETEHFVIYYHEGAEWTASRSAVIAEAIYGPITELYDYEFNKKIDLIFRDDDDYANGITYYYDYKIMIWASNLDHEFRGTSDWLQCARW